MFIHIFFFLFKSLGRRQFYHIRAGSTVCSWWHSGVYYNGHHHGNKRVRLAWLMNLCTILWPLSRSFSAGSDDKHREFGVNYINGDIMPRARVHIQALLFLKTVHGSAPVLSLCVTTKRVEFQLWLPRQFSSYWQQGMPPALKHRNLALCTDYERKEGRMIEVLWWFLGILSFWIEFSGVNEVRTSLIKMPNMIVLEVV